MIKQKRGYYQVLPEADAWAARTASGRRPTVVEGPRRCRGCFCRYASSSAAGWAFGQRHAALADIRRCVLRFGTGSTWPRAIEYLFEKLSEDIESLHAGDLYFKMDRNPQHLSREECRLALALMAHIVRTEITVALQKTQGIYRVLDLYEGFYDAMLRSHGRLTFTDIQYLLTAGNRASGGSVISRLPSAEARLYIDYRSTANSTTGCWTSSRTPAICSGRCWPIWLTR